MNIRVLAGAEALCEAAALPEADTVVVAVCGFAALRPTLTAIREKSASPLPIKRRWSAQGRSCRLPRGNPARKLFRRFRALGHFPVPHGLPGQREVKRLIPDLLRRAVFREDAGRAWPV